MQSMKRYQGTNAIFLAMFFNVLRALIISRTPSVLPSYSEPLRDCEHSPVLALIQALPMSLLAKLKFLGLSIRSKRWTSRF